MKTETQKTKRRNNQTKHFQIFKSAFCFAYHYFCVHYFVCVHHQVGITSRQGDKPCEYGNQGDKRVLWCNGFDKKLNKRNASRFAFCGHLYNFSVHYLFNFGAKTHSWTWAYCRPCICCCCWCNWRGSRSEREKE